MSIATVHVWSSKLRFAIDEYTYMVHANHTEHVQQNQAARAKRIDQVWRLEKTEWCAKEEVSSSLLAPPWICLFYEHIQFYQKIMYQ